MTLATQVFTLQSLGLITGEMVEARVEAAPAGHGIVFTWEDGGSIPARLEAVVHTDRGVTLAD